MRRGAAGSARSKICRMRGARHPSTVPTRWATPVSHSHQFLWVCCSPAGGAAHLGHRPHEGGEGRLGDVPDLVAHVAVRSEQIEPAGFAPGEGVARAHLHHLGAAGPARRGDVGEVDRRLGVGDLDDGGAVGLDRAGQGIEPLAGVVADVDDAALALPDRQRLVGGARLQVVHADEPRVEGLFAVTGLSGLGGRRRRAGRDHTRGDRHREPVIHGRPPGPGVWSGSRSAVRLPEPAGTPLVRARRPSSRFVVVGGCAAA